MAKITNPIIPSDYPDVDVIRVEDTYYMVSTTMHFMPGAVILGNHFPYLYRIDRCAGIPSG